MADRDTHELQIGDPVVVKPGTADADLEIDVSGWHGRVTEIAEEGDETLISVQWDSVTLRNAPAGMIVECEENGMDWSEMYLLAEDVEPAEPRDTEADVVRTIDRLEKQYAWSYLGEQGDRIRDVLAGVDPEDDAAMLIAWRQHLQQALSFPFTAIIFELQPDDRPYRRGDRVRVTRILDVDPQSGVIVAAIHDHDQFQVPLKELAATDEGSPTYQFIDDYSVWFTNRDRYSVRG